MQIFISLLYLFQYNSIKKFLNVEIFHEKSLSFEKCTYGPCSNKTTHFVELFLYKPSSNDILLVAYVYYYERLAMGQLQLFSFIDALSISTLCLISSLFSVYFISLWNITAGLKLIKIGQYISFCYVYHIDITGFFLVFLSKR